MDSLRLATPAEVEKIQAQSELVPGSTVFAFDSKLGEPDVAVLRPVLELDPVYFAPTSNDRRKALFIWALENGFRMNGGIPRYYFNIATTDEEWAKVVETWGARRVSKSPEYRYVKNLQEPQ